MSSATSSSESASRILPQNHPKHQPDPLSCLFSWNPKYMKLHRALGGKMVPPEERLKPLLISAPALAVAFFW